MFFSLRVFTSFSFLFSNTQLPLCLLAVVMTGQKEKVCESSLYFVLQKAQPLGLLRRFLGGGSKWWEKEINRGTGVSLTEPERDSSRLEGRNNGGNLIRVKMLVGPQKRGTYPVSHSQAES